MSDTQCFGYDYLRQLTQAWTPTSTSCAAAPTSTTLGGPSPYWQTFAYNKIGNRTQDVTKPTTAGGATTTTNYTYPAAGAARPHAVTSQTTTVSPGSSTTTSYGYDSSGNTTTRGTQAIAYSSEGRQSGVTIGAQSSKSIYTAGGDRITYTDPTGTTLYLGITEIRSTPAGLSSVRTYTFSGMTVAVRTSTAGVSGHVLSWIDPDHQNTAAVATNASNGTKTRRYLDPTAAPAARPPHSPAAMASSTSRSMPSPPRPASGPGSTCPRPGGSCSPTRSWTRTSRQP